MEEPSSKRGRTEDGTVKKEIFTGNEIENYNGEENLMPIAEPMLLPEIWMNVLENLSPADFLSAINTRPEWSELMHFQKTSMLFPLILPILVSTRNLKPKSSLTIRQVSKIYKQAMDTCLQRKGTNPTIDFQMSASPRFTLQRHPCNLDIIKEVQPLLTKTISWLSPMGNPFLSGCVTINIRDDPEEKAKLALLLGRFGHHISNLKLRLPEVFQESTISTVISILNMNLPNLKMLRIKGKVPKDSLQSLIDFQQQLPNLEKLVSLNLNQLSVTNSTNGVELYYAFLGKYGHQLTVFYGDLRFFEAPQITVDLLNEQMPNVQMLDAAVKVEGLEKLSKLDWNLKALRLNTTAAYQNGSGAETSVFINVLKVINNFSESLTYLHLDFKGYEQGVLSGPKKRAKNAEERKELGVLPYLEQLQITVPKKNLARFWNFLETSCPNLKWLHFIVEPTARNRGVERDKYLGKRAFEVAPKLRRIWFRRCGQKVVIMDRES